MIDTPYMKCVHNPNLDHNTLDNKFLNHTYHCSSCNGWLDIVVIDGLEKMSVRERIYGKERDPYEDFITSILIPFDDRGFGQMSQIFDVYIKDYKPITIIEVGSWKGSSAIHMANLARKENINVEVVCVDTWCGSLEHWDSFDSELLKGLKFGRPTIFHQFMCNVVHKNLQKYITPISLDSVNAAYLFRNKSVFADMIYIDGGHEYESVSRDFELYRDILKPGGVMIIDDYIYQPVKMAADKWLPGWTIEYDKGIWIKPK